MVGGRYLLVLLVALTLIPVGLALEQEPDHIITNSQDWQDVYSGMLFGELYGADADFLVSTRHATLLLYSISTDKDSILVLTDNDRPFITGYEQILQSRGYDSPFQIRERNMNLRLAEELAIERPDMNRYIVLDDVYGYNAISVAPYAARAGYYVLFADEENFGDVQDFLEDRGPEELIIYGQVDREVKDSLEQFSPETINEGNRFDNNIEIVKRYLEVEPTQQAILTNGEFIESGVMNGQDPVLFLGRENVPESVRDFIAESQIEVGILVGNELVGSATFVRRQLGINVFVKFAQGARQPTGPIAQVEDLDRFPMPRYEFELDISSVVYNRGTGALEVTYENPSELPVYFSSTITIRDGDDIKIAGDESAVFLDGSEFRTIPYEYTEEGDPLNLQSEDLSGDVFTVFGEGSDSLESTLQESFDIEVIEVLDDSRINITDFYYDEGAGQFFAQIRNTGDVDAYVDAELVDVLINDEEVTVGADELLELPAGESDWIPFTADLVEEDFAENPEVLVRAFYGERELSLVKIVEEEFPFRLGGGYASYALYAAIALVIFILLWFLATKKKCKHCGHENPRGRKTCEKCGRRFKK